MSDLLIRCRRPLTNAGIAAYLCALATGIALHGLNLPGKASAPAYFVVWDMFCNWNGYEARVRYIGEGESGQHYDLAIDSLGPSLHGSIARDHYDFDGRYVPKLAAVAAMRTDHEPLSRIYVVEENWSKQFNRSPTAYQRLHARPYERVVHRNVRCVVDTSGHVLEARRPWFAMQHTQAVMSNPTIAAQSRRGRPLYAAASD